MSRASPPALASSKRTTRAALARRLSPSRRRGRKVVFTNGCFDLVHAGHVRYLERARKLGDLLVVGVNTDASVRRLKGEGRPILPLRERVTILGALAAVDYVVPFSEDTPAALIRALVPNVLVKGADWKPGAIVGRTEVLAKGGRVRRIAMQSALSTSQIIRRIRSQNFS